MTQIISYSNCANLLHVSRQSEQVLSKSMQVIVGEMSDLIKCMLEIERSLLDDN